MTGKSMTTKRWRIRVARNGRLDRVPTGPFRADITDLRAAGWTLTAIAAHAGVTEQALSWSCLKGRTVSGRTADAVHGLWVDYCAPAPRDTRRWPAGLLRAEIERRWPAAARLRGLCVCPMSVGDRHYLSHTEWLDTARADRLCVGLGLAPEMVWPGWFGDYIDEEEAS